MRFRQFNELVEHQKECPQKVPPSKGDHAEDDNGSSANVASPTKPKKPRKRAKKRKLTKQKADTASSISDRTQNDSQPPNGSTMKSMSPVKHGTPSESAESVPISRTVVLSPSIPSMLSDAPQSATNADGTVPSNPTPASLPLGQLPDHSNRPSTSSSTHHRTSHMSLGPLAAHSNRPTTSTHQMRPDNHLADQLNRPAASSSSHHHHHTSLSMSTSPPLLSSHSRSPSTEDRVPPLLSSHSRSPSSECHEPMPVLLSSHSRSPSGENPARMGGVAHSSHSRSPSGHRSSDGEDMTQPAYSMSAAEIYSNSHTQRVSPGSPALPPAAPFYSHSRSPSGGDSSDGDLAPLPRVAQGTEFPSAPHPHVQQISSVAQLFPSEGVGLQPHATAHSLTNPTFSPLPSVPVPFQADVISPSTSSGVHLDHPQRSPINNTPGDQISSADRHLLNSLHGLLRSQSGSSPNAQNGLRGQLRQAVLPLLEMYQVGGISADNGESMHQLGHSLPPPTSSAINLNLHGPAPEINPFADPLLSHQASHDYVGLHNDTSMPFNSNAACSVPISRHVAPTGHPQHLLPHPISSTLSSNDHVAVDTLPPLRELSHANGIAADAMHLDTSSTSALKGTMSHSLPMQLDPSSDSSLKDPLSHSSPHDAPSSSSPLFDHDALGGGASSRAALLESANDVSLLASRSSFDEDDSVDKEVGVGRERKLSFSFSRRSNMVSSLIEFRPDALCAERNLDIYVP